MSTTPEVELRRAFQLRRERNQADFDEAGDPDRFLLEHTAQLDALITQMTESLPEPAHFCILGIGGYGRRELYPASDVDLLFVLPGEERERSEAAVTRILHALWDAKLQLGQQVWSLSDLRELSAEQFEFFLALLDVRAVAGEPGLIRTVQDEVIPERVGHHRRVLIEGINQITQERHSAYRNTIYQLEPDIKNAPGGLRDFQAATWLGRLTDRVAHLPYTPEEVQRACRFLKDLRIRLHLLTRRNQNRLTHRLQEAVIERMGNGETTTRSGVEALMKNYFLNARVIHGFCLQTLELAFPARAISRLQAADFPPLESLRQVLSVFQRSLHEDRPLSDALRADLVRSLSGRAVETEPADLRPQIEDLCYPRPGQYRVLSEMYELGVLEMLFPEFGSIKALVIRDFYHKYTVDEHTLLAIRSVEELLSAAEPSDRRFCALLEETAGAHVLTLALLLHDVGKSREGKHAETSARMAGRALRRYRFPEEDIDLILFLIRQHLAMSSVIFRRDLEDEAVIGRFVDLINDPLRLRLLTLLTYADIKAVGPGTLNDWKKDLLWQLYVSAYRKMTLGYGEERIEEEDVSDVLFQKLPADLDPNGFETFLEGFPRRYLTSTPRSEIYEHYRLAARLSSESPIQLRLVRHETHYELCVVTPDQYRLFARIVGLLSYFDMNILRGHGFANHQNTVLDLFQFTDVRNTFRLNPQEKVRFKSLLVDVLAGKTSVQTLLEGKERSIVFQPAAPLFTPSVYFEEEHSDHYSILEIVAPDSLGLLYRISREIARLECNIELVLISTEGEKAVDVFYLSYGGSKLPAHVRQQLSENILKAIG